jgi:hypothetical protein
MMMHRDMVRVALLVLLFQVAASSQQGSYGSTGAVGQARPPYNTDKPGGSNEYEQYGGRPLQQFPVSNSFGSIQQAVHRPPIYPGPNYGNNHLYID